MKKIHEIFFSRPLFYTAVVFALGILYGHLEPLPFFVLSLFAVAAFILSEDKKIVFCFLCFFFLGAFLYQNTLKLPCNHISNYISKDENKVLLQGTVINSPDFSKTIYNSSKTVFLLKTKKIKTFSSKWKDTKGLVRVTVYDFTETLEYGDFIILNGKIFKPNPPSNPGQFDYSEYLKRKNIYALCVLDAKKNNIEIVSKKNANFFISFMFKIKKSLKERLYVLMPYEKSALISAMLLGERENLSDNAKENFLNSGTMHILAVSGLHVGIIALILLGFLKLTGMSRRYIFIITVIFLALYCFLTGARTSAVRATVMAGILLIGKSIYREYDIYNSIGTAAFVILLFNPLELFDVGFILSFAAVTGIVFFTPKIESKFTFLDKIKDIRVKKILQYIIKFFSCSIAVWISIFPIIWKYFNIVTGVNIIANLIVIPLSFGIILFSAVNLLLSYIYMPLAEILSFIPELFTGLIYKSSFMFSHLKFGHIYLPDLKFFEITVYYLLIAVILNRKKLKLNNKRIVICVLLGVNLILGGRVYDLQKNNRKMEIVFFDVSDADSFFIKFPCGSNMLIDCGNHIPYDAGKNIISAFLWSRGIRTIDFLVLTHPDSDHIGGSVWLLDHFRVKNIIENGGKSESRIYQKNRQSIKNKNIQTYIFKTGDVIIFSGGSKVKILEPSEKILSSGKLSSNDKSLVMLVSYKKFKVLFCADAEEKNINDFCGICKKKKKVNIIKVPHHGRIRNEAVLKLLKCFNTAAAIFSCSDKTSALAKVQKNINSFKKENIQVYLTSKHGAVEVLTDGKKCSMATFLK